MKHELGPLPARWYCLDRDGVAMLCNDEAGTPYQMPPERMAYEARKLLRDTMTHEERGAYINRVLPVVRAAALLPAEAEQPAQRREDEAP